MNCSFLIILQSTQLGLQQKKQRMQHRARASLRTTIDRKTGCSLLLIHILLNILVSPLQGISGMDEEVE